MSNAAFLADTKTDIYALSAFTNKRLYSEAAPGSSFAEIYKLAQKITEGITNDYDKVRAIHDWVSENYWYWYGSYEGNLPPVTKYKDMDLGSMGSRIGLCEGYAALTLSLLHASGIPARFIDGSANGPHSWNEVYADNRWFFIDTTWDSFNRYENGVYSAPAPCRHDYFDTLMPDHLVGSVGACKANNADVWDGTLYFVDSYGDVIKTVLKITMGLLTSTYGFRADQLFSDNKRTKLWDMKKDVVDGENRMIFTNIPGVPKHYVSLVTGNPADGPQGIQVKSGSKITKPNTPVKSGYTFVGWCINTNPDNLGLDEKTWVLWDFDKDTVKNDMTLYAKWTKGTTGVVNPATKFTVTYNSNGGTAVKSITANKSAKITAPKAPTKSGYTFVGWYKDAKFTKVWNFSTDTVNGNTTLYANWKKK